ncbi:hypothetical protein [Limobrevibacterium gyesilva]|uniref:Uncharacterized protein n=1 Tax=Limobrevibacterium gyesilva TaxID=2991712 RepID=A0AA42CG95_9PROT|nr:hypothetical protein [Limobrevibacterium gyesilva]MCW3473792.1 hypothetical protein [Limobrevibacterium gyesilva]
MARGNSSSAWDGGRWNGSAQAVLDELRNAQQQPANGPWTGPISDPFAAFVDALVQSPVPALPVAVGENGADAASSQLFWAYDIRTGFHLDATAGFLNTQTGNGGFSLDVRPDGSWILNFAGSNQTVVHTAGGGNANAPAPPPAGNTELGIATATAVVYNGAAGNQTINGQANGDSPAVIGNDTIFGGVGDYMIGGLAPHQVTAAGNVGNCAIYTTAAGSSVAPGSVLADMEDGRGYGSNAEGNTFVNIDQVRGSLFSNVLIGSSSGTDLKSGGDNSILISTGGQGYELRPDGTGNVLVSTVGGNRILLDPTHAWSLTDTTTMLGFNAGNHDYIDLSLISTDFHTPAAAGYNPLTGTGDITDYVKLVDQADGEHLIFDPAGNVQAGGYDILDLKLLHGLDAQSLYNNGNIVL